MNTTLSLIEQLREFETPLITEGMGLMGSLVPLLTLKHFRLDSIVYKIPNSGLLLPRTLTKIGISLNLKSV